MADLSSKNVYNVIILDETGSMSSIKNFIIGGFNELIQNIKSMKSEVPENNHFVTFTTFNSRAILTHLLNQPVEKISELSPETYNPNAMTPLYDAIGHVCNKMIVALEGEKDYNVLVTILTDGEENNSREYRKEDILALIRELKAKHWTFTFIGSTDIDAHKIARDLGVEKSNIRRFDKDEISVAYMFNMEIESRKKYNMKIKNRENTDTDYYSDKEALD